MFSWLILAIVLALLFISWDPYTLRAWFNADNLQMIGFFFDMVQHHYPITQQSLSQAMYWFPDVAIQAVMASLSGFNPAITLIGGGWLTALATMVVGHACLQRLLPADTTPDQRQQITALLNGLMSLSIMALLMVLPLHRWSDPDLKYLWFPHMLLWPCFHNGVILMTLMALWLRLKHAETNAPQWVMPAYLGLMVIGTLSDCLLLFTWVIPLTCVTLLNPPDKAQRQWLYATWTSVGIALGMIVLWQHVGHFAGLSITWDWPHVALRHWLEVAKEAPLCIWLGLVLAVMTGAGLVVWPRYRTVGIGWLASLWSMLVLIVLTQLMQDYQAFRYCLPFMGLSLWVIAGLLAWRLSQWEPYTQRISHGMAIISVLGALYLAGIFCLSGRLMQVMHFTPPLTPCLNALGPSFNHTTGLAEYWMDRPNELFTSLKDVRLLTVYWDGKPRHWLNNAQEWRDPTHPGQSPPITFVIMKNLESTAVQATWGAPDEVITCEQWPEIQFWVFTPARRYAHPLE